jgi:hypothetical protein
MRRPDAQFELFDAAHGPVGIGAGKGDRIRGYPEEWKPGIARIYKNRGNEAKKSLKKKDLAWQFACQSAAV